MAQLTVYLDDETRNRIDLAAKRAGTSVSQWVKEKLTRAIHNEWPSDYFELFGSLAGSDLKRPEQPSMEDDQSREPM